MSNNIKEGYLYREKTKDVIRDFIQQEGRCGYEKLEGSSYQGFMYEKKIKESNHLITFDIRLPDEGTMIFEAYGDMYVTNKAYLPAIKRYCQERIAVKSGAINVDNNTIQFHIEDCLMEYPVSAETLEIYESEAIRVLELHYNNLNNLAIGKCLSLESIDEKKFHQKHKKYNYSDSIKSIKDYLTTRAEHNAICEKLDENNNTTFYSQLKDGNETYRLSFIFTDEGILKLKGIYSENAFVVPEPYRYAVADYINDENARHKYGALSLGQEKEGVSCNMCTSLLDGIIGEKTIEFMQNMIIITLSNSIDKIHTLGAGLILKDEEKDEDDEFSEMLEESEIGKEFMNALDEMVKGSPRFMEFMNSLNKLNELEETASGDILNSRNKNMETLTDNDEFLEASYVSVDSEPSMNEFADSLNSSESECWDNISNLEKSDDSAVLDNKKNLNDLETSKKVDCLNSIDKSDE